MTNRRSRLGRDGMTAPMHDPAVVDKAKTLLRKMETNRELDLVAELTRLLINSPEVPAAFARLFCDMSIREPAPITSVLSVLCHDECFPRGRSRVHARQIARKLLAHIRNPEKTTPHKLLAI